LGSESVRRKWGIDPMETTFVILPYDESPSVLG
jgi:hypothetical protein